MDIKFRLGAFTANITPAAGSSFAAKVDVEVQGIEYEVTGLNIAEYVQVMAAIPGIMLDLRTVMESPLPVAPVGAPVINRDHEKTVDGVNYEEQDPGF